MVKTVVVLSVGSKLTKICREWCNRIHVRGKKDGSYSQSHLTANNMFWKVQKGNPLDYIKHCINHIWLSSPTWKQASLPWEATASQCDGSQAHLSHLVPLLKKVQRLERGERQEGGETCWIVGWPCHLVLIATKCWLPPSADCHLVLIATLCWLPPSCSLNSATLSWLDMLSWWVSFDSSLFLKPSLPQSGRKLFIYNVL